MRDKAQIARQISQVAERQHGYVTRGQLLALGIERSAITRSGDLIPVYAGVYAVGHRERQPIARAHAAVLACGDGAVLSHDSAAALWGLCRWPTRHEVIAPHQRQRTGIVSHRSTTLARRDITWQLGILVTTPVRTICDIARRRTDDLLLKAVDEARAADHLTADGLQQLIERCPRVGRLVAGNATRSKLERDWRRFAARHHFPPHHINVPLHGYLVDVYFPEHRLVVEIDGWQYHRGPRSFRTDRLRDTVLKDHGIDTVRLTADRFTDSEGARLHRILDLQVAE